MPGIFGLITKMPHQRAERELRKMLAAFCHEPFYTSGTWIDETTRIYVGWVSRRGSFADGMPLRNERSDVPLIYSGEDFAPKETVAGLKGRGHDVDPDGPSYLVHLYEEDPYFFSTLNGRFQGLLIDRTRETATIFNDRYGLHRLYYNETNEAF